MSSHREIYKLDTLAVGAKRNFQFRDYFDMLKKKRGVFQNAMYHGVKIKTHILHTRNKNMAVLEVTRIG